MTGQRQYFDAKRAELLIGKYVLAGVARLSQDGSLIEQQQVHGHVRAADEEKGILLELLGVKQGELFTLPPDLSAFDVALPGEYELRSTGEVVTDPDFIATWEYTAPEVS